LFTCYAPVRRLSQSCPRDPRDLHVLSTPPAFVLSQDQTLQENSIQLDESNSCLTLSRGQRVRIIEIYRFELGSPGPCRPVSNYEFASHILIPLSIVKQLYSLAPSPFRDSLESYLILTASSRPKTRSINLLSSRPTHRRAPVIRLVSLDVPLWRAAQQTFQAKLPGEPNIIMANRAGRKHSPQKTCVRQDHLRHGRAWPRTRPEPSSADTSRRQRGAWFPRPPARSAPSRNRTENLLIKSQLL
jgi:hypothetical protein